MNKLKYLLNTNPGPLTQKIFGTRNNPSLGISLIPVLGLLTALAGVVVFIGSDAVSEYGPWILLTCAATAVGLSIIGGVATRRGLHIGLVRSAKQIMPAIPILVGIALVATTWMLSGVVPTLIAYGLQLLSPQMFLLVTCSVCAIISVMTGSSWTTIATIGVAFMGIGQVMGFSDAWIAGAIISGAYFGDKISPLSDTTVVASSTAGVDLFEHIRYLMITTIPAMTIALAVFMAVGYLTPVNIGADHSPMISNLQNTFHLTPWTLTIPAISFILILLRIPTLVVLGTAAALGAAGIFVFQPGLGLTFVDMLASLWHGAALSTGNASLDNLVATGGILGMFPTIFLVFSAMIFGAATIGTGILSKLTNAFTSRLRKRTSIVSATVASGLTMNCATADQYLSLILTGNMYRALYQRNGLEPRLLSRAMEDSVSVTSVLIPWNSCGLTQSTVLGVSTIVYAPCCIFNLLTPLMSIIIARMGYKIPTPKRTVAPAGNCAAAR